MRQITCLVINFSGLPFCFVIICLLPHPHTQLQSSLENNHPCGSVWVMICQARFSAFAKWNYQKDGHKTGKVIWWLASHVHFSPKAFSDVQHWQTRGMPFTWPIGQDLVIPETWTRFWLVCGLPLLPHPVVFIHFSSNYCQKQWGMAGIAFGEHTG